MTAKLNHTIVAARDKRKSALFLSEMLGLDPPQLLGPFALVTVGDELTLDFVDPRHKKPSEINRWDDGRGVYFDDPNGHLLEVLTRPYGSGGTSAEYPHPLVAETITPKDQEDASDDRTGGGSLAHHEHP